MSDSLEFRLLRYIVAVAETGNFTRAAERLFLAQPSLSKQIRDLEEELKFPIFDRGRDRVRVTPAGEMVLAYAREALRSRDDLIAMARAVHYGEVPPLRVGFSSFVNTALLKSFSDDYCAMFPRCEIQLAGGDPAQVLHRIDQRSLDCAILLMPIDNDVYRIQQMSRSPLVVCMRSDDVLAAQTQLDIHEIAPRIKVLPDPQAQPAAHARLLDLFRELNVTLGATHSAGTPAGIQWMVKAGYGLALIDQLSGLDLGLITRPIVGANWTVDTAFVYHNLSDHVALPFIDRFLAQQWRQRNKKRSPASVRPEQLQLLA